MWCESLKHYFVLMLWSVVLAKVSHCVMESNNHVPKCNDVFCLIFWVNIVLWFCVVGLILSQQWCMHVCGCLQLYWCFQSCSHVSKYCTLNYVTSFLIPPFSYPFHPVSFLPSLCLSSPLHPFLFQIYPSSNHVRSRTVRPHGGHEPCSAEPLHQRRVHQSWLLCSLLPCLSLQVSPLASKLA